MDILALFFIIIIFLFSVVIHEVAHGAAANALGDPTAKLAGRLTLNPIKHLDPIGSIVVPLALIFISTISGTGIIFGWAKPVPINPYNFRDQKYGSAKSAAAGPLANILIAVVFGLLIRFLPLAAWPNLVGLYVIMSYIVYINLILAVFNLMPIPPLDGSHILFTFLPPSAQNLRILLHRYGFFILLMFIFLGGFSIIFPLINLFFVLITGSPMLI